MPALLGLGLAAIVLFALGGGLAHVRPLAEQAERPVTVSTSEQLDLCVTPRGFCPVTGSLPEGEPCQCEDSLKGTVQGRAWSLDTVLSHPALLPEAVDSDTDE